MLKLFVLGDGVDEMLLDSLDLSFDVSEALFDAANDGFIDGMFETIAFGDVHRHEVVLASDEGLEFSGLVAEEVP